MDLCENLILVSSKSICIREIFDYLSFLYPALNVWYFYETLTVQSKLDIRIYLFIRCIWPNSGFHTNPNAIRITLDMRIDLMLTNNIYNIQLRLYSLKITFLPQKDSFGTKNMPSHLTSTYSREVSTNL